MPIFVLAASAYLATNVDNFFLLVAMLALGGGQKKQVVLGFGVSVLLTLGGSYLVGTTADLMPVAYLGLLGLVPLTIGAKGLVDLLRKKSNPGRSQDVVAPGDGSLAYASALTLSSNSADTIVVLSALLADSPRAAEPAILLTCVGAASVVAAAAAWAVGHPRLERGIRRIAPTLTPWILLFVGLYILANTATDLLPG